MGGGTSTSDSAVLSDVRRSPERVFDLRSSAGLVDILARARSAGLSDTEYSTLRDLVLKYAQSGGDTALMKEIESIAVTFSLGAVSRDVVKKEEAKSPTHPPESRQSKDTARNTVHTKTRRTPVFRVARAATAESEKVAEEVKAKTAPSISEVTKAANIPEIQAEPSVSKEPASAIVTPETNERPKRPVCADIESCKQRIAEIKHAVNMRVGNPVTVIDAGNELGRTYMMSLVAAMRALAGGRSGSLGSAMVALEDSFETLMTHLEREEQRKSEMPTEPLPTPEPELQPTQEPVLEPEPQPQPEPEPEQPTPVVFNDVAVEGPVVAVEPVPTPESAIPSIPEEEKIVFEQQIEEPVERIEKAVSTPEPVVTVQTTDIPEIIPTPVIAQHAEEKPIVVEPVSTVEVMQKPETRPVRINTMPPSRTKRPEVRTATIAPSTPRLQRKPTRLMRTDIVSDEVREQILRTRTNDLDARIANDLAEHSKAQQLELASAGVTNNLNQLLGEWNLFKQSGIFGTGPSGAEHPLYTQLSRLPMSTVLSGRYEGSDPHDTRVIKDYVNAWRNEQGITYNQGETFEHYLRRVVLRIMKRAEEHPA